MSEGEKVYLAVQSAILCRQCVDGGDSGEDLQVGVCKDGSLAVSCNRHGEDQVLVFQSAPGTVADEQIRKRQTQAVRKQ